MFSMSETTIMSKPQDGMPDSDHLWMPAHCAPMDIPLTVRIRDEHGPYKLKSPVMRKVNPQTGAAGWFNTVRETWLAVPVHEWRYHPSYVRPRSKPKMMPK